MSQLKRMPIIKRSCTTSLESMLTFSHIIKHIDNEIINIRTIKMLNYKISKSIFPFEYFNEMNDKKYNKYVNNWNKSHSIKLYTLYRIYTKEHILNLLDKAIKSIK
jgi:transposase-like protein